MGAIGDDGYGRFAAGDGRILSAHADRLAAVIAAGEPWRCQRAPFPPTGTG